MTKTIERTVNVSADKRLHIDIPAPVGVSSGQVKVTLSFAPVDETPKNTLHEALNNENEWQFQDALKEAKEKTAWRMAHPQEYEKIIERCQNGSPLFDGIDGVTFQRQIRDEWEDRLALMGLSDNTDQG
jgi:hypothetical protein